MEFGLVAASSFRFVLASNLIEFRFVETQFWSFGLDELQLILRMTSKDGVDDGFKSPSEIDKEDIETRQIEYLL